MINYIHSIRIHSLLYKSRHDGLYNKGIIMECVNYENIIFLCLDIVYYG